MKTVLHLPPCVAAGSRRLAPVPAPPSLILLFALALAMVPCRSVNSTAQKPWVGTHYYYKMSDLKADMQKMAAQVPLSGNKFAEQAVIKCMTDQLKDQLEGLPKQGAALQLVVDILQTQIGKGGESLYSMDSQQRFDEFAKGVWDMAKDQVVEHALKNSVFEALPGTASAATLPIQVLEAAWNIYLAGLRVEDVRQALDWYVRKRYAYDMKRHRQALKDGKDFRRLQYPLRFPFDFDPQYRNPGPYPFELYQFEPFYIAVRPNPHSNWKWLLGDREIHFAGPEYTAGDELQGMYDLWSNLVFTYFEQHDSALRKALNNVDKNAGDAYVKGIIRDYLYAYLREFMTLLEAYYQDLYQHKLFYQMRRAVAVEAAMNAMIRERNRRLYIARKGTEEGYEAWLRGLQEAQTNANLYANNATGSESNATVHLGERDEAEEEAEKKALEAAAVQDLQAAMNATAEAAKSCESERVNYAALVDFKTEYSTSGPHYTALEYAENQTAYLNTYNTLWTQLNDLWQANANEFDPLREEYVETVQRVVRDVETDPRHKFTPVALYAENVGDVPPSTLLNGLGDDMKTLMAELWWTNQQADASYYQDLPQETLDTIRSDLQAYDARLDDYLVDIDTSVADLPSKDEINELQQKAARSIALYNDLVIGNTGRRGGWRTFGATTSQGTGLSGTLPFYQYNFSVEAHCEVAYDSDRTDTDNFTLDEMGEFAFAFVHGTDYAPLSDDEGLTNRITRGFLFAESLREAAAKSRAEAEEAKAVVRGALDLLTFEESMDAIEDELVGDSDTLHELREEDSLDMLDRLAMSTGVYGIDTYTDVVVCGCGGDGVYAVDSSSVINLTVLGHRALSGGTCAGVAIKDQVAFVAGGTVDLYAVDVSNPSLLASASMDALETADGGFSRDVLVDGSVLYLADGAAGVKVIDISSPLAISSNNPVHSVTTAVGARKLALSGDLLYVAAGTNGLHVLDVTVPTNATLLASHESGEIPVNSVLVQDIYAGLALGTNGVAVLDVSDPAHPEVCDRACTASDIRALALGDFLFAGGSLTNGPGGQLSVHVFDYNVLLTIGTWSTTGSVATAHADDAVLWLGTEAPGALLAIDAADEEGSRSKSAGPGVQEFYEPPELLSNLLDRVEVQFAGYGSGSVTVTPPGTTCTERLVMPYDTGTVVALTAAAESPSVFAGWGDALGMSSNPLVLTVTNSVFAEAHFDLPEFTVTASAGSGGSIDPSGVVTALWEDTVAFAISNSPGYVLSNVVVDTVAVGAVSEYTFFGVTNNHTVTCSFICVTGGVCGVSAGARPGGTISPAGWVGLTPGTTQEFAITPETGFAVDAVMVDGTNHGVTSSYVFTNVCGVHDIEAWFRTNCVTISASAGAGGSIEPAGLQFVPYGGNSTSYTVTADAYYCIAEITTNGIAAGSWTNTDTVADVVLSNVMVDTTLDCTFDPLSTSNGVPLWWLVEKGITSNFEWAASVDLDGDGVPTDGEYAADSSPGDPLSVLRITGIEAVTGALPRATFQSSRRRFYILETRTNMLDSGWVADNAGTAGTDGELHLTPEEAGSNLLMRVNAVVP